MRKKTLKVYAWIISIGFIYFVWVKFFAGGIPCPILLITGTECGGCGITSMFLSMLSLDFKAAFFHNPVMFVSFFVWNLVGVGLIIERPKFMSKRVFLYTLLGITAVAIKVFGVCRNLG